MQPASNHDSLDWPLVCAAGLIAALSALAISHELLLVALFLLIPTAGVAVWLVVRIVYAAKSRSILGITSAVIAAVFAYLSAQWILPGRDILEHSAQAFRFEGERATYEALVANYKLADPHRNFIIFEAKNERQPGEVDQRIAYDETEALSRGKVEEVNELVIRQSPQDAAEFASCRWKAAHLDGYFYVVDFFC
ncbi:hypothetical protein [Burkholderia sp. USMB20]|uniref:hypothetical protein n=1 Tax=Burkholderia sp. USMB20 TaxID=1571773 RepID=UPI001092460C|nr:hypothetical protein [Burkholderia sp. USMB20]TGN97927.1 hypothetical protein PL79_008970 [Burkholderia sp. USMB20]